MPMTSRALAALALMLGLLAPASLTAHDEFRFVGAIVKSELARNRFSVRFKEADGKDETVIIAITAKTDITRDKKTIPKTELRVGTHVVVDALGDDYDTLEALAIRVVPPPR